MNTFFNATFPEEELSKESKALNLSNNVMIHGTLKLVIHLKNHFSTQITL